MAQLQPTNPRNITEGLHSHINDSGVWIIEVRWLLNDDSSPVTETASGAWHYRSCRVCDASMLPMSCFSEGFSTSELAYEDAIEELR